MSEGADIDGLDLPVDPVEDKVDKALAGSAVEGLDNERDKKIQEHLIELKKLTAERYREKTDNKHQKGINQALYYLTNASIYILESPIDASAIDPETQEASVPNNATRESIKYQISSVLNGLGMDGDAVLKLLKEED